MDYSTQTNDSPLHIKTGAVFIHSPLTTIKRLCLIYIAPSLYTQ